jgi:basic membrane protein A
MSGRPLLRRAVALAVLLSFVACTHAAGTKPRVAMLAGSGGLLDHSLNEAAAAGLTDCAKNGTVEIATATASSPADYEQQLGILATQDYDLVIAVGGAMTADLARLTRRFEDVHFAILDGVVPAANVESVTFKEQEGSFLAGALAASFTRTKHIAFLGGGNVSPLAAYASGFVAGAREIDPKIPVDVSYAGSFEDRAAGKTAARAVFARGADVVYVVAGRAGLGAIEAAKESRAGYAIGVDNDQDGLAPGRVLTSVLKRFDRAALRVCLETISQKPTTGHVELGLADGGVGLTGFRFTRTLVGAATLARLARLEVAIERGAIVPPATPAELARFRPVSLERLPVSLQETP